MRYIPNYIKQLILKSQLGRCAGVPNYVCPLKNGFDQSGYEIDHIHEYSITESNDITNLQALCHSCHSIKTKRFMSLAINKKYIRCYEDEDSSDILGDAYLHCKKIIQKEKYPILLSTSHNENIIFYKIYHIVKFNKNIDTTLLIKYLKNVHNDIMITINKDYPYKNNIFMYIL